MGLTRTSGRRKYAGEALPSKDTAARRAGEQANPVGITISNGRYKNCHAAYVSLFYNIL